MKLNRAIFAVLVPVSLFALGCSEDGGPCDDPLKAQDTVLVDGTTIQYGGQAIMNISCAGGICHSSAAKGALRQGAPAGLDFDVLPIDESSGEGDATTKTNHTIVKLDDATVKGLRERQRNIFEKRNLIWTQVKEGLMPPDGMFNELKKLMRISDTPEASPCLASSNSYMDITTKPSQDILRNWLACNTPIVESAGANVDANGVAGQAGYQYISCEADGQPPKPTTDGGMPPLGNDAGLGGMDGGNPPATEVTLAMVQTSFLTARCGSCHPTVYPDLPVDFSSVDKSYATLVEDDSEQCDGKPYVTPGDVSKSFIYDIVSKSSPGCDKMKMPIGQALNATQLKLLSDWINSGAKKQ